MKDWERDLVFMQNEFSIKRKDGKLYNRKLSLVAFGSNSGSMPFTATSILVGYPTGIVAQLILDGKIQERGVLMPSSQIIIETVIQEVN